MPGEINRESPSQAADHAWEERRLSAVRRYDILDTPPDGAFDRITALAARLLRTPIAIVSIVDHDRIWFKSHHGVEVEQIGRDAGLCASCILQEGPWIIRDAKNDAAALANPLVAGEFGLQFYLGIPLRTCEGYNLGTLCVIDFAPRTPTEQDISVLGDLAAVVMDEIELRLSARIAISGYQQELALREQGEQRVRALMRELAHRSKNLLAVVQAISRQTAPSSRTIDNYVLRLAARIQGLAKTHDLITDEDWHGVTLHALTAGQLAPFLDAEPRIRYAGPRVVLSPVAAQSIGIALHELATNSVKHGALSVSGGTVAIGWQIDQSRLQLSWREQGGPPVSAPSRTGFGYVVLQQLTSGALGGQATLAFDPAGFRWELDVPAIHTL